MDRLLCLCSASLVLMLIPFDGCLALPRFRPCDQPMAEDVTDGDGGLKQELKMLVGMLELEKELVELKKGVVDRMRVEVEQMETVSQEPVTSSMDVPPETHDGKIQPGSQLHAYACAFLERYGYLPILPRNVQHKPDRMNKAIKKMQRMYHLNETGELDNETLYKMSVARCGMKDATPEEYIGTPGSNARSRPDKAHLIAENFYVSGTKWSKLDLTWKFRNYNQLLSQDVTKSATRLAFKLWSDVTPLTFAEADTNKPDINLEFARGLHEDGQQYAFDGPGGVVAHSFFPEVGKTHFDDDETWTDGTYSGINFFYVAAHEFGHAIGLDHSNVTGALMQPDYNGYKPNLQLSPDDIQAVQSIYGGPIQRPQPVTTYPVGTNKPYPVRTTTRNPVRTNKPYSNPFITRWPENQQQDTSTPPSCDHPKTCDLTYKVIMQVGSLDKISIFSGQWMWLLTDYGLDKGFPLTISTYYQNAPDDITAAIFSWKTYYTYFFKGRMVWRYQESDADMVQLVDTKTIDNPGYPDSPQFAIACQDTILLVKDGNVWQFDEDLLDVEDPSTSTPFDSMFPGAPATFDSALRLRNDPSYVYFFSGTSYYKYKEDEQLIVDGYPKDSAGPWMGPACGADPYTPK